MAIDPYAQCTCGSGKKFKWCCGPIHEEVDKVFRLDQNGQHEAALRLMKQLVAANPNNPEIYGQQAVLYFRLQKPKEAEQSLNKAFALNPNYPYGYVLRGRVKLNESDYPTALALFRKASTLYDPQAHKLLSAVYGYTAECEMSLQRPVAARAALKMAISHDSSNAEIRESMEKVFGDESALPLSARREYTLKSVGDNAPEQTKEGWKNALAKHTTGKLQDAAKAFEQILAADNSDAAAWYNLGLIRAWLGDNSGALEALDEYVQREPNAEEAADAWALGEVLRMGQGVQLSELDLVNHLLTFEITNGERVGNLIQKLEEEHRLFAGEVDPQQQVMTGMIVEAPKILASGSETARKPQCCAAHVLIYRNMLRLWGPNRQRLLALKSELEELAGDSLALRGEDQQPAGFDSIFTEALLVPIGIESEEEAAEILKHGMTEFYEEVWLQRPLHALQGNTPIDAAQHDVLRKKLFGVIQFHEECSEAVNHRYYSFDRLRHKLGLTKGEVAEAGGGVRPDISAMNASELSEMLKEDLPAEQVEDAYHAARRLDAQELSHAFLKKLIAQPVEGGKADRLSWYGQLIDSAVKNNQLNEALEYVDEGEKTDCEYNEGRRRNDYELWRGRVHAKRGDLDQAKDVFERLIDRDPTELRYATTAAEAMLSSNQHSHALQFAEAGLAQARKQQDRDSEEHFLELIRAAGKKEE